MNVLDTNLARFEIDRRLRAADHRRRLLRLRRRATSRGSLQGCDER